jgi:serine protease Do
MICSQPYPAGHPALAILILSASLWVEAWPGGRAWAGEAREAAPAPPAIMDDQKMLATVTARGKAILEAGKTTPMADLIAQLRRGRCEAKLRPPSHESLATADIYEASRKSVVILAGLFKCPKCGQIHSNTASGFLITESGIAVTSRHVVDSPSNLTLVAMTAGGQVYPVKAVLASSAVNDLALVQIEGSGFTPLPVAAWAPVGSDVLVIGHPDRRFYTLSKGIVSRYGTVIRDKRKATVLQVTASFARGSSGGPVLDGAGNAVGVVTSTASIFTDSHDGQKETVQMVLHQCVPGACILELIGPPLVRRL